MVRLFAPSVPGPVDGIAADPQYLDVTLAPNATKTVPIDAYRNAFAYVFDGAAAFRGASDPRGVHASDHGTSIATTSNGGWRIGASPSMRPLHA